MNNVKIKLRGGRTFVRRKPKHTPQEIAAIAGTFVTSLHGVEFVPGYDAVKLKKRSRNRAANKRARLARRVTRHGR